MNRLLIVDGSNLLFQMFFGMPARIVNKQGKAIQGTPFAQLNDVCAALDFIGIKYAETTFCEADDLIAGYTLVFGQETESKDD